MAEAENGREKGRQVEMCDTWRVKSCLAQAREGDPTKIFDQNGWA